MPRIAERAVTIRPRIFSPVRTALVAGFVSLAGCQGAPTDTNFILTQKDLPALNTKLREMRYDEVRGLDDVNYAHLSVFFYGTDKYADQLSRLNGGGRPADRRSSLHELYCGLSSAYCSIPIKKLSLEEIGAPREVVVESREADAGVDTPTMELEAMVFENQPDAAADVPHDVIPEVRPEVRTAEARPEETSPILEAPKLQSLNCSGGYCTFTLKGVNLLEIDISMISVNAQATEGEFGIVIDMDEMEILDATHFRVMVEADPGGQYHIGVNIAGQAAGGRNISF